MSEAFFRTFNIGIVTNIILIIIVSIFIIGLIFTKKNIHHKFVNYIPSLLTSIGVFGTFLGIVLGLLNFDQTNIEASIPPLLAGLKTAFITSVAGMLGSLTYKTLSTFSFLKAPERVDIEHVVYPVDYLKAMHAQVDEIKNLRQDLIKEIEPKLSEQINSLRTDMNANSQLSVKRTDSQFILMQQEYEKLQQTLFEIAAINKATFDELKLVMVDFNHALTEQFSNKFKFFHDGLVKSLEWQENYKVQFQQMQMLYGQGVSALKESEASIINISDQSKSIPNAMEDLRRVIEANQYQINELGRHLAAFDEIREKAVDALPYINQNLTSMTDKLTQNMTSMMDKFTENLTSSIEHFNSNTTSMTDKLANNVSSTIDHFATNTTSMTDKLTNNVSSTIDNFTENTNSMTNKFTNSVSTSLDHFSENTTLMTNKLTDSVASSIDHFSENTTLMTNKLTNSVASSVDHFSENTTSMTDKLTNSVSSTVDHFTENTLSMTDKLTNTVASTIENFSENTTSMTDKLTSNVALTLDNFTANTTTMADKLTSNVASTIDNFSANTTSMSNKLTTNVSSSIDHFTSNTTAMTNSLTSNVSSNIQELNTNMTSAIELLTSNTTSMSEKLTNSMSSAVDKFSSGVTLMTDSLTANVLSTIDQFTLNATSMADKLTTNVSTTIDDLTTNVSSSIDGLTSAVSTINEHHQNLVVQSGKIIKEYLETSNGFIEQFAKETNIGITHIRETNINLADDMERVSKTILSSSELLEQRLREVTERAAEQQIEQANRIFSAMEEQIDQQSGFTANAVKSQLKHLDQTLHREINRVMTEMGNALTQISGQFLEDYTKLTAAMYRIVTQHRAYKQQLDHQNNE